jgi:hypothetical protein
MGKKRCPCLVDIVIIIKSIRVEGMDLSSQARECDLVTNRRYENHVQTGPVIVWLALSSSIPSTMKGGFHLAWRAVLLTHVLIVYCLTIFLPLNYVLDIYLEIRFLPPRHFFLIMSPPLEVGSLKLALLG